MEFIPSDIFLSDAGCYDKFRKISPLQIRKYFCVKLHPQKKKNGGANFLLRSPPLKIFFSNIILIPRPFLSVIFCGKFRRTSFAVTLHVNSITFFAFVLHPRHVLRYFAVALCVSGLPG